MLIRADARQIPLLEECVQTCVTSPPYFALRDYGTPEQIGLERTPEEYVDTLVQVFNEVRRVLRHDGTLWIVIGDSYCNADKWGGGGVNTGKHTKAPDGSVPSWIAVRRKWAALPGLKSKDLIGIPWMLAFALRGAGWYLRSDVIWAKPNPMPESVTDRPTKAHDYLFLFAKGERYLYDSDAIREPYSEASVGRYAYALQGTAPTCHQLGGDVARREREKRVREPNPNGRNRRSVWTVTTQPFAEAHFATFPPALIEPCILAGSRPGDLVLDPFIGSGTTGAVCERLGRRWVGCDLTYQHLAKPRTAQRGLRFIVDESSA